MKKVYICSPYRAKDGAELDVKDEHMDIDVTFKDASSAVQVKDGEAKRI